MQNDLLYQQLARAAPIMSKILVQVLLQIKFRFRELISFHSDVPNSRLFSTTEGNCGDLEKFKFSIGTCPRGCGVDLAQKWRETSDTTLTRLLVKFPTSREGSLVYDKLGYTACLPSMSRACTMETKDGQSLWWYHTHAHGNQHLGPSYTIILIV